MPRFSQRSLDRLNTCHPDIRRVMLRAIAESGIDFTVLEGVRSLAVQRLYYVKGATKTMKSRHLAHKSDGLSRAVDVAPWVKGAVSWHWPLYNRLAIVIKEAAEAEGVPLEWGGDWRTFKDGPHWQLPWKEYP